FSVSGVPMGGEGKAGREAPRVEAAIHAASKIARVEIIRDGQIAQSIPGDGADLTVKWSDAAAKSGRHWYLLKVIQADQEMAWTAPVWIVGNE
ncbi:hypothetical protein FJY63_10415, partial [Candidatus Sumerlaeota bacterium]|nr:hypothetical protein [Candidatus Sumerlaeota bacterium]